jgi:alkanesulfonate monooxygenase SsuD/methylene tetrahydromethanopterin reductase-like flavin-dependent oxidoreductase (luciferase family)
MLPAARKGAAKAGRGLSQFAMCVMPLVATAEAEAELADRVHDVRARVAFYASTPAYLAAFETQGHGEAARQLQALSRAQRWEEMPALVNDEMLDAYAVIGTYHEIAAKLKARFAGLATHLEFRIPVTGEADKARLRDLLTALRQ